MSALSVRGLLACQVRVVLALVLRDTRVTYGSSSFGYIWAIVTPAASIGFLVFVFSNIGRQAPFGTSLALFFATGILTLQYFQKLSNDLAKLLKGNNALLSYPLIKYTDLLFARLILISATNAVIMFVFYGSLILLGMANLPSFPERLVQAFFATALIGFGFGTLSAVIASIWDSWVHVIKILTRPLFFVSGIFYIPSLLPPDAIAILEWNPVLHLVEWTREGYYPNYESAILDRSYPLELGVLFILLGLFGERVLRKRRV